jgi:hypothetical protein
VATEFGVSQMRIRQLIAEGRLPPPITLSRDHAWHVVDVAAARALYQGRRANTPTGMLPDAGRPLRRPGDLMPNTARHRRLLDPFTLLCRRPDLIRIGRDQAERGP